MTKVKVKKDDFSLFTSLLIFIYKLIFFSLLFLFLAKQRAILLEWLKNTLPDVNLPLNASEEDLRMCLIDGTILCRILNMLRIGSVIEVVENFLNFSLTKSYYKLEIDCQISNSNIHFPLQVGDCNQSTALHTQKIKRFLAVMGNLGIPSFKEADLEKVFNQ